MKSRLISIEGKLIGITGIDEIFARLFEAGRKPGRELQSCLLEELKRHNYIPRLKEQSYAGAFLREYEKFCDRKNKGVEDNTRNLGTWQGTPREEVPWFPTIMEELCDGCRICLDFCSFGVFGHDEKRNKVEVANPYYCQVGCSICAAKCKPKAILFPPLRILESFRKRQ
jgi:NAD-dependent dihydropyrimidine dehydrogenase PreA subunit